MPKTPDQQAPQAEFLVLAIVQAVAPVIEAKCGELSKRDHNTLKGRIEKAVRQSVAGANPSRRKTSPQTGMNGA